MTELDVYLENEIGAKYAANDEAHDIRHIHAVHARTLRMLPQLPYLLDNAKVKVIVYYHDVGISFDREKHHIVSADILRGDTFINSLFSKEDVELMASAVEDHRSSNTAEPRSIYGMLIADADRDVEIRVIVDRFRLGIASEVKVWKRPFKQHATKQWLALFESGVHNITEADLKEEVFCRLQAKYIDAGRGTRLWLNLPEQVEGLKKIVFVASSYDLFSQMYDGLDFM